MMMVRVDPRVEPAAGAGVTRPQNFEKSTEIIFSLCKSAWLLENAFASNSSAACF